jgi:hypothetical protein
MMSVRLLPLFVGGGVVVLASVAMLFRGRGRGTRDREHERRLRISQAGRITDGTILDAQEHPSPDPAKEPAQLLVYTYNVAGVQYECSQDISYLRQFVDLHSCRLGLPASVKYDSQNPGNSIVISEEWSGLRK